VVCIVNWNGRRHLEYSLPSLMGTEYPNLEILLVDNASTDGSVEYVRETFPKVSVVQNGANLMWAGGNNVGIRRAMEGCADWVVLANNDIRVDPRWAEMGMRVASADSAIGIIGYDVVGQSIRADVDEWHRACTVFSSLSFKNDRSVDGCFMMVRTESVRAVGLIDEVYGLYGEDNDFVARVIKAGMRVVRCNVPIWHYSEGTSSVVPLFSAYMSTRNELRYYVKQRHMSVFGMLRWLLRRMVAACDIRQRPDMNNADKRRRRPTRNVLVNASLVLRAFWWNVMHLHETRAAGLKDEQQCAAFRVRCRMQNGI
jgi:GT2 family glycosyltransferase